MIKVRSDGFTLIEVLVTIVVLGLLGISLLQVTRIGMAAWDGAGRRQRDLMLAEAAERTLRDAIGRMIPRADETPPLLGTPGSMAFRARGQDAAESSSFGKRGDGPIDVSVGLDASNRLVLRELGKGQAGLQESVLMDAVERLIIGYWRGDAWSSDWRSDHLPRLIRLEYRLRGREGRQWPAMIIAVRRSGGDR